MSLASQKRHDDCNSYNDIILLANKNYDSFTFPHTPTANQNTLEPFCCAFRY